VRTEQRVGASHSIVEDINVYALVSLVQHALFFSVS
jgi:hypothetical protein